jgi:hypothetical protein
MDNYTAEPGYHHYQSYDFRWNLFWSFALFDNYIKYRPVWEDVDWVLVCPECNNLVDPDSHVGDFYDYSYGYNYSYENNYGYGYDYDYSYGYDYGCSCYYDYVNDYYDGEDEWYDDEY